MKWLPLHLRRQLHLSSYVMKIIKGQSPSNFINKFQFISGGSRNGANSHANKQSWLLIFRYFCLIKLKTDIILYIFHFWMNSAWKIITYILFCKNNGKKLNQSRDISRKSAIWIILLITASGWIFIGFYWRIPVMLGLGYG